MRFKSGSRIAEEARKTRIGGAEYVGVPEIREVKEVYSDYPHLTVFIVPDPNAGLRARYSTVLLYHSTGRVHVLAREAPLDMARSLGKHMIETERGLREKAYR